MTEKDSLQDTISRAREELSEVEQSASSKKGARKKNSTKSLLSLAALAVVLLLFKLIIIDAKSRQLNDDLAVSALDLFMEADASVVIYFTENRRLPEALPEEALRSLVSYERVDPEHYTLRVNIAPHNNIIQRDAALISPPSDINALLNL